MSWQNSRITLQEPIQLSNAKHIHKMKIPWGLCGLDIHSMFRKYSPCSSICWPHILHCEILTTRSPIHIDNAQRAQLGNTSYISIPTTFPRDKFKLQHIDMNHKLKVTLDEGPGSRVQWNRVIIFDESHKLDPQPLDEHPRPKCVKLRLNLHGIILIGKSIYLLTSSPFRTWSEGFNYIEYQFKTQNSRGI